MQRDCIWDDLAHRLRFIPAGKAKQAAEAARMLNMRDAFRAV